MAFKDRLLMGSPVGATEERASKDIVRQLKERTEADLAAWDAYTPEVRKLALDLASALNDQGLWPSRVFLPDDPADIPLGWHLGQTDRWDLVPGAFAIVEKDFGIKLDLEWWTKALSELTYAQAIERMLAKNAEPGASGNSRLPRS